ncbi:TetR/AcrR family transcriptional regulator [Crossiella cryophila]|uniref:AcrR family transcriptional regulator n=1 Tax=Crossiella cryophila TaxID=43355 RepID=A0A7W7CI30_9PSEU|nr:TetR/AcrR family transcriptional regulator [Crossiella cryophila]MBB4680133.1 AcrR family transcriptional regulator [Crossiella cryophila]
MSDRAPAPRGRPRDERVDQRILDAVVAELAERGVAGFASNRVAARSGVAKRSIYSRWPNNEELILAGLSTLTAHVTHPRTGSVRGDLTALAEVLAELFTGPRCRVILRCETELAEYPELHERIQQTCVQPMEDVVREILRNGVGRGELRADVDIQLMVELLTAAVLYGANHAPNEEVLRAKLIAVLDSLLRGLLA